MQPPSTQMPSPRREVRHVTVSPPVLYFGTPVALITTIDGDGRDNIGPMSSVWALADKLVMGWNTRSQTLENLIAQRECVVNLPGPQLVEQVEALAPLSGRNPPPEHNRGRFRYEPDKFAAAGLTRQPSQVVRPPRIAECPMQIEATVTGIHAPSPDPEADSFRIVVARVRRVHCDEALVKDERHHIDTARWSPLLYIFRHYHGAGPELARSFRAED